MQMRKFLFRRPGIFARAVAFALLAFATPSLADAHAMLKRSLPASGAHLATVPREIRLDFTEDIELSVSRVELRGPDGTVISLAPLAVASDSRRSIIAGIRGALGAGTYTVIWVAAGTDGHPRRGRFIFTIAPGATRGAASEGEAGASSTAPGQADPPASHHNAVSMPEGEGFGAGSPAYIAIRWLLFTGLLIVIGAVAFRYAVLGVLARREQRQEGRKAHAESSMLGAALDRSASLGLWATGIVALAVVLRLIAQSYAMHGPENVWNPVFVATMVARTVWGWGWLLQGAGVVVAAVGFMIARRGSRSGWPIATLGALMLALTPALSGHAASAPRLTVLAVLADWLHVVGAGGWLGSLLMLLAVGIPVALRLDDAARGPAVADLVNAFSPTALVFAGLAASTGVFSAWLHLGTIPALWQTTYGQTLLVKLGILSVVVATGAYNWLRVKPALGNVEGAVRIRRSATIELAVGVLVLVVTAVLVATPTAMDEAAMSSTAAEMPLSSSPHRLAHRGLPPVLPSR